MMVDFVCVHVFFVGFNGIWWIVVGLNGIFWVIEQRFEDNKLELLVYRKYTCRVQGIYKPTTITEKPTLYTSNSRQFLVDFLRQTMTLRSAHVGHEY